MEVLSDSEEKVVVRFPPIEWSLVEEALKRYRDPLRKAVRESTGSGEHDVEVLDRGGYEEGIKVKFPPSGWLVARDAVMKLAEDEIENLGRGERATPELQDLASQVEKRG